MKKLFAFSKLYDMIKVKRQARLRARLQRLYQKRVWLINSVNCITEQIFTTLHQIENDHD